MNKVLNYLNQHSITYTLHEHPAVFTCEEAKQHCAHIPGIACKNLFLKNKKSSRFFLVILPADKRADLKLIAKQVDEKKLSFGNETKLKEKLNLEPGSVSPFGLLNNHDADVELYIDKEVYEADIVNFHPNTNTASIELTREMFHAFLQTLPQQVHIMDETKK